MLKRFLIGGGIILVLVAAGWFAGNWWVDTRLRQEISEAKARASAAEQETEAARQQTAGEVRRAKDDMIRWRDEANRRAQENQQLAAERKALLDKVTAAADAIDRIRKDVANVPASQILAHLRLALVALREPVPPTGSGAPAH